MSEMVYRIFSKVHKNYDRVNTICSLGTIVLWRKDGAREAMINKQNYKLLDIATGTGELALEIARMAKSNNKKVNITGIDFSPNMLSVAKEKEKNYKMGITFKLGDAMKLDHPSNNFDVVTSAFALRNVDDLNKFAREAKRVLKNGGKFVFMDMARPDSSFDKLFIDSFWTVMLGIGVMEDKEAYIWLRDSVNRFDKHKFLGILKKQGFKNIKIKNLLSGAAFMVTGNK
jgi:demethylmenaquinone methyltransferase / 2-methoxy-6-polyprenyl-1,4-benzoquinol methylase